MSSHKNTLAEAFMLRQEGDPPRHGLPPKQKILKHVTYNKKREREMLHLICDLISIHPAGVLFNDL